jgi:diaminobutyrate-2-oxoglutarate transaminase
MSVLLIKPELDIWEPGEHNGTFRGNQLAFVGATAALEYRESSNLEQDVKAKELFLKNFLSQQILPISENIAIRGIGMIWGIDLANFGDSSLAKKIGTNCFEKGLIIERAGRNDTVIKLLPPLTIDMPTLKEGCSIMKAAFDECL